MVGDARSLLVTDLSRELESTWGIAPDGTALDLDRMPDLDEAGRATAQVLRAWHAHALASERGTEAARRKAARDRMVRESAFTSLNRLVALRLCEARGVIAEAIRGGQQAEGFSVFEQVANGGHGDRAATWRAYLDRLCDELAAEVPLLFERRSAASQLAPSTRCLEDVVAIVDRSELDLLWESDETIGWVYQYFNTDEDRERAHTRTAPRDQHELAVRNQFFTPRYVVEFLTDNTLGRMWWEMQEGGTRLTDDCRFLYQEPRAILLTDPGWPSAREAPDWLLALRKGDASRVPHRLSRREMNMLALCIDGYAIVERRGWGDPVSFAKPRRATFDATGSWPGDLLELWVTAFLEERRYHEVHADPQGEDLRAHEALYAQLITALKAPSATIVAIRARIDPRELRVLDPACGSGHFLLYAFDLLETIWMEAWDRQSAVAEALRGAYPDRDAFLREVPALILRHNLWGVDIDPRAAQIAALALWLRAQKSWGAIPPGKRPAVRRTNIVVAEAMPGDRDLFDEFVASLKIPGLRRLMTGMWEKLRPAGEMGVLLRVEDELRAAIEEARQLSLDDAGTVDETPEGFWKKAEAKALDALRTWAESSGRGWDQRRMFAEDVARGFAFVDLCRQQFNVILMNPPFGDPSEGTREALSERYPACNKELYALFYQRSLEMVASQGRVGAITNRTWIANPAMLGLRTSVFGTSGSIAIAADLGSFVLDALVETIAAVVQRDRSARVESFWIRTLSTREKEAAIRTAVAGSTGKNTFAVAQDTFSRLPSNVFAYWASDTIVDKFASLPRLGTVVGEARRGTDTGDDFRFYRLSIEIPPERLGLGRPWMRHAKGGEYRPFFDDVGVAVRWESDGKELSAWGNGRIMATHLFGRKGVTWPLRTSSAYGPRALPEGCGFSGTGPTAFFGDHQDLSTALGTLTARPTAALLAIRLAAGDNAPGSAARTYHVGIVADLPWPGMSTKDAVRVSNLTKACVGAVRRGQVEEDATGETVVAYVFPPSLTVARAACSLRAATLSRVVAREDRLETIADATAEIDRLVADAYGFNDSDKQVLDEELEPPLAALSDDARVDTGLYRDAYLTKRPIPGDTLPGGLDAEVDVRVEHRRGRQMTLRTETALCRLFGISPRRLAAVRRDLNLLRPEDVRDTAMDFVHYAVGVAFGRWDLRLALESELAPEWPDAFGALPRCPVGQLVDREGLPATPERVVTRDWLSARRDASNLPAVDEHHRLPDGAPAEAAADSVYPVPVAWSGLLADDDGVPFDPEDPIARPPAHDLATRVADVFARLFGNRGHDVLQECCEALGVKDVREYLRAPAKFFADHLSRYSKSRRKAPIYWPLSVASGSFTAWVYYPRLSAQTLHALINDLLLPRLARVDEERARIESRLEAATGRNAERLVEARDKARAHAQELRDLRAALDAVNALPFRPDLDDGVVINAAPLRALFRLKPWRDELDAVWKSLTLGEYDWAHLAMTLRRDEVLAKCKTDKSIAIAHGREDLYVEAAAPKRGRKKANPTLFGNPAEDDA